LELNLTTQEHEEVWHTEPSNVMLKLESDRPANRHLPSLLLSKLWQLDLFPGFVFPSN
jgi:hypothetical protein